jgi:hypothetical protein
VGAAFRGLAFWGALIVSTIFLLMVAAAGTWAYLSAYIDPPAPGREHMGSLVLTYGILLAVAGVIFSSVFFGWRVERREAQRLQREVTELRFKYSGIMRAPFDKVAATDRPHEVVRAEC